MDDFKEILKSFGGPYLFDAISIYIEHGKNDLAQSLPKIENTHELFDDSGSTLLHRAAECGNEVMVQYLIDNGCAVDALNQSRKTPLMLALDSGSIRSMEILLEAKADVFFICDDTGFNVLQQIFCCPSLLMAKEILKDTVDLEVYCCTIWGRESIEKYFHIEDDSPPRSRDVINLFLNKIQEICGDDNFFLARMLMHVGCSLVKAVNLRKPEVIKMMLKNGMHVNEDDCDSEETALHVAVELLEFEQVKLLLQHGANVNARGTHGQTPIRRYPINIEDRSDGPEMFKFLIDNGASLTSEDNLGKTPMSYFLQRGNRFVVRTVLEYVGDLTAKDEYEMTPVCNLTQNENHGVLEPLRGQTFNENLHSYRGFTPLFLAIINYDLEKVKFWLEHGANVNLNLDNILTPISLMFQKSDQNPEYVIDVIATLLQYGADAQCIVRNDVTILDYAVQNNYFFRAKPVIAHLIVREHLGEPIKEYMLEKIDANCILKKYFKLCQQQIKKLKNTTVLGSITLMKLLIESEEKITLYARNPDFLSKFERKMMDFGPLEAYIGNMLRERVGKAVNSAQIKERAAFDICRITGLTFSASYTILYKILDYLNNQDFENLQLV